MTQTAFIADDRVERWLKRNDVTFTGPVAVRLVDIDTRMSRNNQARDVALDAETVESYRIAIRNGEELPALVVVKRGSRYSIIDGNNRQEAARLEEKTRVNCYVVDQNTTAEQLTLLTLSANATNGKSVSKDWKLHQSRTLIAQGYTVERTAAALQVPVTAINAHIKLMETAARARKLRIQGWDTLPKGTREVISRIKLDPVFAMVAEIAISAKVVADGSFKSFVTGLNRMATQEEQQDAVREWGTQAMADARALQQAGRVRRTYNPKLGLMSGLGNVTAFDTSQVHLAFAQPEERETLSTKIKEALRQLLTIEFKLHDANNVEDWVMEQLTELGG